MGRRRCQEGMVDGIRCEVAPGGHGSSRDAGPKGKKLEASQSLVQRCYSTGEGTWGSGSLGQGSKELVTRWSVTGFCIDIV
jgi:hypothetical protein